MSRRCQIALQTVENDLDGAALGLPGLEPPDRALRNADAFSELVLRLAEGAPKPRCSCDVAHGDDNNTKRVIVSTRHVLHIVRL
jgi:hypothetical protein